MGCGQTSDTLDEAKRRELLQLACAEVTAYNDLVDADDFETANSHWAKVLNYQNQLNAGHPDHEIKEINWGLICAD